MASSSSSAIAASGWLPISQAEGEGNGGKATTQRRSKQSQDWKGADVPFARATKVSERLDMDQYYGAAQDEEERGSVTVRRV